MTLLLVDIRVRPGTCPLAESTRGRAGVELRYVEMARLDGDSFAEIVEVRGDRAVEFVRDAARDVDITAIDEAPGRIVCRAIMGGACVRSDLARRGWIPIAMTIQDGVERVTVPVRDADEARELVAYARERYPGAEVARVAPHAHLSLPVLSDGAGARALTRRQREVLNRAIEGGYFEADRALTAGDIAHAMGIHPSTFGRHLRAALRKVLRAA